MVSILDSDICDSESLSTTNNNKNNNKPLVSFSTSETNINPIYNAGNSNGNEIKHVHHVQPTHSASIPVYAKIVGRGNKSSKLL